MHKRSQHSFISRPELLCERPTAKLLPRKISCFLLNICVCCLLSRTPRPQVSLCGHCAFKLGGLAVLENTILLARTPPHTCTQGRGLPIEPGVHSDRGRCRSDWLTGCGVSWLCVCVRTHTCMCNTRFGVHVELKVQPSVISSLHQGLQDQSQLVRHVQELH